MIDELKKLKVFDRITYFDKNHTYKIDGEPSARVSVTGLVGCVKEKFDENKWSAIKAKEHGITPEEMRLVWKKNNQMSTYQGSTLHNYIDNYYQNKVIPYNRNLAEAILGQTLHEMMQKNLVVLVKQFNNFYNTTKDYILPIKNEFVVGDLTNTKVCGMLDMLAFNTETNTFEIYDFKTNKRFSLESEYKKNFLPPVEHLDECEFNSYSLQLSLYKMFIEKYTDIKIGDIKVIWFSINNEDYKILPLKFMPDECAAIMEKFLVEQLAL